MGEVLLGLKYSSRIVWGEAGLWGSSDAPPGVEEVNISKVSLILWSVGMSMSKLRTVAMIRGLPISQSSSSLSKVVVLEAITTPGRHRSCSRPRACLSALPSLL